MYAGWRGSLKHISRFRIVFSNGIPRHNVSQNRRFYRKAGPFFSNENAHIWPFLLSIAAASGILGGSFVMFADEGQQMPVSMKLELSKEPDKKRKKVLVLGTGWAAISFLKNLDSTLYDIQVVSPRNFFVFTPLLPSVTVGTVEPRSITESIRKIMRKKKNVVFCQGSCIHIDPWRKKVLCRPVTDWPAAENDDFEADYDYLIVAVGAQVNTFNTPGVEDNCHFLKEIEDAEKIRESIVDCFELAALPLLSEDERKQLLQFVTVGGGPTGVEFSAELHDLVYEDLRKLYPDLMQYVNIVVIQSADHILNMFDQRISRFAEEKFQRDGIEVKTGCLVMEVQKKAIVMKEKSTGKRIEIPHGMVVWSTGIGTRPVIADFMKQIGQVASQQGEYLALCFNHRAECEAHPRGPVRVRGEGRHGFPPFVYKHFGQFVPLGGERAAAELPGDWVSCGRSTQWLWYSVYLSKQVSWRTRALVLFDWTKRFIFGRDTSRM